MGKEESESQTPKRLSTIIYYVACEFFSVFKKRYFYDSQRELFTCVSYFIGWSSTTNQPRSFI